MSKGFGRSYRCLNLLRKHVALFDFYSYKNSIYVVIKNIIKSPDDIRHIIFSGINKIDSLKIVK